MQNMHFFWRDLSICLVWVEALMRSQQKAKLRPSSGSHAHAQSFSFIKYHRPWPTWFQRLGWLQRHQRPPFHTRALQSKLYIPFWDLPELARTSARPWFLRAWWSKVCLTSPSSPTFHESVSWWRKAGTRRGGRCTLESPGQSVTLPWRLYHSSTAWYTIKIKKCKIYQICKIWKTYTRILQSSSASTSASVLGTNLGRIFCRWMPIARWIMK